MRLLRILAAVAALCAVVPAAWADDVRIGAWNIEWLEFPGMRSGSGRNIAQKGSDLARYVHSSKVDVLALAEIGDSDPGAARRSAALDSMVASLAQEHQQQWRYVLFPKKNGAQSPAQQLTGVAWNTGRVTADETAVLKVPVVDDRDDDLNSWERHPHALKFTVVGDHRNDFVVVPLHMKSNRGVAATVRRQRAYEARTLVDRLSEIREHFADEDVVLLGDTNVLGKSEQAVRSFVRSGLKDLNATDTTTFIGSSTAPFDRIFVPASEPEFAASTQQLHLPVDETAHRRLCSDHFLVYCDVAVTPDDDDRPTPDASILAEQGASEETAPAVPPASSIANARVIGQLRSALWMQTSGEYRAASTQTYRLASLLLPLAVADSAWVADVEQQRSGGFERKPPAVILDLDETVLDNSPYQARVLDRALSDPSYTRDFDAQEWSAWVREKRATAIPGATTFLAAAAARGVAVFFITNRTDDDEPATLENLRTLGINATAATVLSHGQGVSSDKQDRRAAVAANHRIVLLVGDDLGDFVSGVRNVTPAQRDAVYAAHESWFGSRWLTIPNAMYGSWWATLGSEPEKALRKN